MNMMMIMRNTMSNQSRLQVKEATLSHAIYFLSFIILKMNMMMIMIRNAMSDQSSLQVKATTLNYAIYSLSIIRLKMNMMVIMIRGRTPCPTSPASR